MKKYYLGLTAAALLCLPSGCSQDETTPAGSPEFKPFPRLVNTNPVPALYLEQLTRSIASNAVADLEPGDADLDVELELDLKYDLDYALVATYDQASCVDFIYMPLTKDTTMTLIEANTEPAVDVFFAYKGEVLPNMSLRMVMNSPTQFTVIAPGGRVVYTHNDTDLLNVEVSRTPIPVGGRTDRSNDLFQSFIDCEGAAAKKFADHVCGGCGAGQMAWTIGCNLWAPCRGAGIAACVIIAITLEKDKYGQKICES